MKTIFARLAMACASTLLLVSVACTADIHDNTADVHDNTVNIDDAKVEFTTDADVDNVKAGQPLAIAIIAENVFLVEPGAEPPAGNVKTAGHFQIYFDDFAAAPLVITAQKSVTVTMPATTPPGQHKVICRIHKHDGTPTTATFEIKITITVS
jgi:plastocyanin